MLKLFRTNTIFSFVGLLLFAFAIRLSPFFKPLEIAPPINSPFAQLVFEWLANFTWTSTYGHILATVLIYFQAILINYISSSHNILYRDSLLPAMFFVILNSLYPQQLLLTPQLFANTFLILLLYRLCYLYESTTPLLLVFDAGIMLGLGMMFDYDLIIYLPFILVGVMNMTSFNLRYWMVAIFGLMVPAYFLGAIFFLTNHLSEFIASFEYSWNKSYFNPIGISIWQSYIWFLVMPILLLSIFDIQLNFFKNKVKTRRILTTIYVMLGFGVVSVLAENQGFVFGVCFLTVSLSILLANFFISEKRFLIKESTFWLMMCCIIYYQYFNH